MLEDRLDRSVGTGADVETAVAGRLQPVSAVLPRQAQDAEAGAVALLGMGPALQDQLGELGGAWTDYRRLSSVLRFSLIMGFENSLVGIPTNHSAGARPGGMVEPTSVRSPRPRGGGADGPTWRTDDDPGTTSTGAVGYRDRAADGSGSEDGAQIYRARCRSAGLRAASGRSGWYRDRR